MYRFGALIIFQLMLGAAGAQQVTFNLAWLPQGSLSGVIVAIDLGYYAELGLEVKAVRGPGKLELVITVIGVRGGKSRGQGSGSRLKKVACGACGYTARVTTKWLDQAGAPLCPCNKEPMQTE